MQQWQVLASVGLGLVGAALNAAVPQTPPAASPSQPAAAVEHQVPPPQPRPLPPDPHKYDLVLHGGHVIDAKNNLSAVRDVGIKDGKIAAVEAHLDAKDALKTIDATGLYVTPGLVDIHVHVYAGTGEARSYAGDLSIYPDGFMPRVGVTTAADAGCSGWRNFEDFKAKVIDRSRTRILAFINIVGNGMRGGAYEQNLEDMQAEPTAEMIKKHKDVIIGVKTAHYAGPEWTPVERAVQA